MPPIQVLIVDDSAVVRQVLSELFAREPDFVVTVAPDPVFALAKMPSRWPDVIVLDVEMPRMDGLTFLRRIMAERPTPVVICSSLTEQGAETTMQAMAAGAVGIITKPKAGLKQFLEGSAREFVSTVRAAARANLRRLGSSRAATPAVAAAGSGEALAETTERLVAIGTSTGGTQALEEVLTALPRVCPGLVIVQHMPEKFTASFAARLDGLCAVEVREAQHNDRVLPGRVLIAPGGRHMTLKRSGAYYHVEVVDGPLVNHHRPSVDVLFRSVARYAGRNALGVILTGMGDDGARGLLEMRQAGAATLAQDEETCVVYGMPKEAVRMGAAQRSVPLQAVPQEILRYR